MIKVEKGTILDIRTKKVGYTKTGNKWVMFLASAEGTKDSLAVFANNADEAETFTRAVVGQVTSVSKSAKRREDGSWETRVTVNAFIDGRNERAVRNREAYQSFAEQVNNAPEPTKDDYMDFTKAADFSGDDLPFN